MQTSSPCCSRFFPRPPPSALLSMMVHLPQTYFHPSGLFGTQYKPSPSKNSVNVASHYLMIYLLLAFLIPTLWPALCTPPALLALPKVLLSEIPTLLAVSVAYIEFLVTILLPTTRSLHISLSLTYWNTLW